MNDPAQPPAPPAPPADPHGSLPAGFLLAWAAPIGGYIFVSLFLDSGIQSPFVILLLLCLPWIFTIGLVVRFYKIGKPQTGKGMLIGLAALAAVALLLVAACFSMLAGTNFH